MSITNRIRFNNLRGNIVGGVTANIVSLLLALAFGVASGIRPIGGLYGAIALKPYVKPLSWFTAKR